MKVERATPKQVAKLVLGLSDAELRALVDEKNLDRVRAVAGELVAEREGNIFFFPLEDAEVPEPCRAYVPAWRKLAGSLGWNGHIAYRVRKGYTLKVDAPKSGACYQDWVYLKNWKLTGDQPTDDATVYWVPRLVSESTGKNVKDQLSLLADLRNKFELPKHHLKSFGSVALLSGLILSLHQRTGERVPSEVFWVRTDTLRAGGSRLNLGLFGENGLNCDYWNWDELRYVFLGCFPLGVELGR